MARTVPIRPIVSRISPVTSKLCPRSGSEPFGSSEQAISARTATATPTQSPVSGSLAPISPETMPPKPTETSSMPTRMPMPRRVRS